MTRPNHEVIELIEKDDLLGCIEFLRDHTIVIEEDNDGNEVFETPMHVAAKYGRDAFIPLLMSECPEHLDWVDEISKSPVHYAAKKGHLSTVLLLAKLGCKLKDNEYNNPSAFHVAVANNQEHVVEALFHLDKSLLDRYENGGYNPICEATCKSLHSMIRLLDRLGTKYIRCKTIYNEDTFPIHVAAWNKDPTIMGLLLDLGAYIDLVDHNGKTPMHQAVNFYNSRVVELLDARGSKVISEGNEEQLINLMCKASVDADTFKTLVRLGCTLIDERIIKNITERFFTRVDAIATVLTLFPSYTTYFNDSSLQLAVKLDVKEKLEDEEFCAECRKDVYFAESLVVRLLRLLRRRQLKPNKH